MKQETQHPTDEAIIARLFNREQAGLEQTARKYGTYCLSIARRITGNAEDAEECVNDTWLRVWNSIPPQRPASLRLFVASIVRNLSLDVWRKRNTQARRGETVSLCAELEECLPMTDGQAGELPELLDAFLAGLDREERTIFLLRYWYAVPTGALAKQYGLGENAMAARLYRTRTKLRAFLEARGYRI